MSNEEFEAIYRALKQKFGRQQEIAEALGISRTYLSKIKNGTARISPKMVAKLREMSGRGRPSNTLGIPDTNIRYRVLWPTYIIK